MSMLVTENGTAYSDNFFRVEGTQVINMFTKKPVGILVRVVKSTNYLCIESEKNKSIYRKLINWFSKQDEDYRRVYRHDIPENSEGDLVDTMKNLKG
jgi:hypothetical protein